MQSQVEQAFTDHITEVNRQQEFRTMQDRNKLEWLKTKRDFMSTAFEMLGYKRLAKQVLRSERLRTLVGYVYILEAFSNSRMIHGKESQREDAAWIINGMYLHGLLKGDFK